MEYFVAKSYQGLEKLGMPYESGGKMYTKVKMKNGTEKQVRAYTLAEYNKMYPEDQKKSPYYKPQKLVLGFDKGYITIFRGDGMNEQNEWFRQSAARYAKHWGWYFRSIDDLPEDIPENCTPVKLPWDAVSDNDDHLNNDDRVALAVETYLYPETTGEYAGAIGDKVELILMVVANYASDTNFGVNHMICMEDEKGNRYIWNTTAKDWAVGTIHHVRGTIKDLKMYHGQKETFLTRCREV